MGNSDATKKWMQLGVFKTKADLIEYLLVLTIGEKPGPTGSWSLKNDLEQLGINCGTATVGRYLKSLDVNGFTRQVSNQGRELTPYGKIWLEEMGEKIDRAKIRNNVSHVIRINEYAEMVDLIRVRKLIEVYAARLAAQNATEDDLNSLEESLKRHHKYVDNNLDPVDPALDFHIAVAQASRNKFLYGVLSLLTYEEKQIEAKIETLKTREMGNVYVVKHEKIANAIRNRDAAKAAELMEDHMQEILEEIENQIRERNEENEGLFF